MSNDIKDEGTIKSTSISEEGFNSLLDLQKSGMSKPNKAEQKTTNLEWTSS